jgi:P pilus assembly chaperone PapD
MNPGRTEDTMVAFSFFTRILKRSKIQTAAVLSLSAVIILSANDTLWAQGSGDLVVSPTRVLLEGKTRSAALSLVNRGANTATFRISVINMNMSEDGQYKEVTKPEAGGKYAKDLFRYSPRRVVLKPGASQAIRILLRKPAGLASGEYRSHMFIRGVPKNVAGRSIEKKEEKGENVRIQLLPIYGVTLPIIVRHGSLSTKISVSDMSLMPADSKNRLPRMRFRLNRTGSASAFGDIRITYRSNSGSSDTLIGELNKLAVYTPNKSRVVEVRLRVPDNLQLTNGNLDISYRATGRAKTALIASATHPLP